MRSNLTRRMMTEAYNKPGHMIVFDKYFYMKYPYALSKYMTAEELQLLFYLVDWAAFLGKLNEPFFCRMKQIMEELNISVSTQTRQMRALSKKGYVTLEKKGMPPVRWITINWELIDEQCTELYPLVMKRREQRKKEMGITNKYERVNHNDDVPYEDDE